MGELATAIGRRGGMTTTTGTPLFFLAECAGFVLAGASPDPAAAVELAARSLSSPARLVAALSLGDDAIASALKLRRYMAGGRVIGAWQKKTTRARVVLGFAARGILRSWILAKLDASLERMEHQSAAPRADWA